MIETPEILLGLSGLQESNPSLGNGLRMGVGGLALLRALQVFEAEEGLHGKLEGFSALGLAAAGGASVVHGPGAEVFGRSGEVVHGLCEMALGLSGIHQALHDETKGITPQLALGLLTFTKGASTFLPMVLPSAGTAVAIAQLGILGAKSLLVHSSPH